MTKVEEVHIAVRRAIDLLQTCPDYNANQSVSYRAAGWLIALERDVIAMSDELMSLEFLQKYAAGQERRIDLIFKELAEIKAAIKGE